MIISRLASSLSAPQWQLPKFRDDEEILFKSTGLPLKEKKITDQPPNIYFNGITENTGSDTPSFARQNGLEYFTGSCKW